MTIDFPPAFQALTGGRSPFRWQQRMFDEIVRGQIPDACDVPTGLGKTSVMAIWLAALDLRARDARLPRRLVYVVDRRAVVDQATTEAEQLARALGDGSTSEAIILRLRERLQLDSGRKLPISTLRGQYTDNREWLSNPTAPAIVVGTVDMVGSRLLFSGYGVSAKMRPYHAGFLGADALVVLDEAHLVPPFEALLKTIASDPETDKVLVPRSDEDRRIVPRFRLMSLSATGREGSEMGGGKVFRLSDDDHRDAVVKSRLDAPKRLTIEDKADGEKKLPERLAERAWVLGTHPRPARILVYCHSRDDAVSIKKDLDKRLEKQGTKDSKTSELLVGARRVYEREALFGWLKKNGFVGDAKGEPSLPTFLVATAAGEVGVDLDADHMVCDLVEWERMVQRLGRVNRRGSKQARIEVIGIPSKEQNKGDEEWEDRLARLRAPLDALQGDASPGAIAELKIRARNDQRLRDTIRSATSPVPLRPQLTRALVDAWSMTSLDEHTGRPEVQPWLRGWVEDLPQTSIVWRRWLPVRLSGADATRKEINEFFEAAPPHTSEVLETETRRVCEWLIARAGAVIRSDEKAEDEVEKSGAMNRESKMVIVLDGKDELVELLDDRGKPVRQPLTCGRLADLGEKQNRKDREAFEKALGGCTLVVSADLGGLNADGMLDDGAKSSPHTIDDGLEWLPADENGAPPVRFRVRRLREDENGESRGTADGGNWRRIHEFVRRISDDGNAGELLVVEQWRDDAEREDGRAIARREQTLEDHCAQAEREMRRLGSGIGLPSTYIEMLAIAARLHDEGKRSERWQRAFNATRDGNVYAKTNGPLYRNLLDGYRHEFGSLPCIEKDAAFRALPADRQDLVLHLVAAHHGGARPLISARSCDDAPPSALAERVRDVALRFARLQKRWGPWGLAWWEALVRAADQQASRENDAPVSESRGAVKIKEKA
jgi:CRISPR-associated endonuclease/helicase Cas3